MYPQLTKKSLNYPHGTRCEKDICIKLVQNVGYVITFNSHFFNNIFIRKDN